VSIFITTNANAVAADLGKGNARVVAKARAVIQLSGRSVESLWRSNAEATAGEHGKHYPKSIKSQMVGPLEARVAPDESMPQGGMSFEYGSVNQPPHLDGQRAIDVLRPTIEARLAKLLDVL
jgi:hypothetical protein